MTQTWLALVVLLAICTLQSVQGAGSPCRFASLFNGTAISRSKTIASRFLDAHAEWESLFVRHVGVDPITKLTYDGHRLDFESGLLLGEPHLFSAPSKESIHVGLMARYLADNVTAQSARRSSHVFESVAEVLHLASKKGESILRFNEKYPGFGGFLPWFSFKNRTLNGSTVTSVDPISPGWTNRVPALDNGEFFWSAFALRGVLENWYADATGDDGTPLHEIWGTIVNRMLDNALTVFYAGNGTVRCVTRLSNQSAPVQDNQYESDGSCSLDDPYEGELFVDMLFLLSNLTDAEKDLIWVRKRRMLSSVNLTVRDTVAPSRERNITVQRGFWFSAHEQWKYLMLPYKLSSTNWAVYQNGERARTWFASKDGFGASGGAQHPSPGLWASVTSPVSSNSEGFQYFSACGIRPIAFEDVLHDDTITPYATFPLLLLDDQRVGAAWLHNTIAARKGQNVYGTTESMNVSGTGVGSLVTWDSKGTTLLASVGGIADLTARFLGEDLVVKLVKKIESEWGRVFSEIHGADLKYKLPEASVPELLEDYVTCSATLLKI